MIPHDEGKILRLKQQYFFVSASLNSIVRSYLQSHEDLRDFHQHICIHINDTHPVLAIPELMRILIDDGGLAWDEAWEITTQIDFLYESYDALRSVREMAYSHFSTVITENLYDCR